MRMIKEIFLHKKSLIIDQLLFNVSLLLSLFLSLTLNSQTSEIKHIDNFGTNPGNLNMYFYSPEKANVSEALPLVIVLHGCTQNAPICARQTGWNTLANRNQFYVVYPEQVMINNAQKCFNWFKEKNQVRGSGEPESIKQMIDYMKSHFKINSSKIYIIGMSAGAAMSSIMTSVYPDVFDKGGVMAGVPYKAVTSIIGATKVMLGTKTNTPENWSQLIKNQNPTYTGEYPELIIFHGDKDRVVNINNSRELVKQWTKLNGTDDVPDSTITSFDNNTDVELSVYKNQKNNPLIYFYKFYGIGHALPLDTGKCPRQGGHVEAFSLQKDFFSTYWAADFFGLIKAPYQIIINESLNNSGDLLYKFSVPENLTSTYKWEIPKGSTIIGNENSSSVLVKLGRDPGFVTVTESLANGCKNTEAKVFVKK